MNDVRDWKSATGYMVPTIIKMTGEWRRDKGFDSGWHNFAEKLMLIITEGDEAMEALDGMRSCYQTISQPGFYELQDACQKLILHLDNYVEEWVDVMVRIFDVAEACGLVMDETIDPQGSQLPNGLFKPIPHAELVSSRGMLRFTLLCRALSKAMECFRDVTLEPGGRVPEDTADNRERVRYISNWMYNAALVSAHAIEDVGLWWDKPYVAKMEKNEKRPSKHGRQR